MVHTHWIAMLLHLRHALRTLRRQGAVSLLAAIGLAFATAAAFALGARILHEAGYDRWYGRGERIVRVNRTAALAGGERSVLPVNVGGLARALPEQVEGIAACGRMQNLLALEKVRTGERTWKVRSAMADRAILEIFGFRFLHGDPATALSEPFTVVLFEPAARRLFGEVDPVGRELEPWDADTVFTVTGVLEAPAFPTHLRELDLLQAWEHPWLDDDWTAEFCNVYALLEPGVEPAALQPALDALAARRLRGSFYLEQGDQGFELQPVERIHWEQSHPHTLSLARNTGLAGSRVAALLGTAGLVLLVLGCLNAAGLLLARPGERGRYAGVARLHGSGVGAVALRFLLESALLALVGVAAAAVLLAAGHGWWRPLVGLEPGRLPEGLGWLGAALGAGVLLLTALASLPAALGLGRLAPRRTLLAGGSLSPANLRARRISLLLQLALVGALLLFLFGVRQQHRYLEERPLGYPADELVRMDLGRWFSAGELETLQGRVEALPAVAGTAGLKEPLPGPLFVAGKYSRPGGAPETFASTAVTAGFAEVMDLEPVAGRWFGPGEAAGELVINRTGGRRLGLAEGDLPAGIRIEGVEGAWQVVGILPDFHYESLFAPIGPLALYLRRGDVKHLLVRTSPGGQAGLREALEAIGRELHPGEPLEIHGVREQVQAAYRAERSAARLAGAVLGAALLVALLGLLGLAAASTERRRRELAVRKVHGASLGHLSLLLLLDQLRWIALALLLGLPAGLAALESWLGRYACTVPMGLQLLLGPPLLMLTVSGLLVLLQSLRTLRESPLVALRSE